MDSYMFSKQFKVELAHFLGVNQIIIYKGDLVEKNYTEYYEKVCIRKLNYAKK